MPLCLYLNYYRIHSLREKTVASSLNLSLTNELRKFVDSRTGDSGVYATPSEYIRDLIRHDMEAGTILNHVLAGLDDIKQGQMSENSILDIADES